MNLKNEERFETYLATGQLSRGFVRFLWFHGVDPDIWKDANNQLTDEELEEKLKENA
jgi:hypothetical protein